MNKRSIGIIISIVSLFSLLYMIGNMVYAASFSVLVADDFSHGVGVGAFHVPFGEYVVASLKYAKKEYYNWQGTYFSMFIQALLSPINNYGFRQLRCVMAFNALLFFCSLIYFACVSMHRIDKDFNYVKIAIVAIIVFSFCGYDAYPEVFFWFSGATSYSIPLSLLFFAAAFLIMFEQTKKNKYMIGAIILGILVGGGSLTVSAAGCFFAVVYCVYIAISRKEIHVKSIIVSCVWIISSGVNAIAPGNFRRHGFVDSTGIHPIDALNNALEMSNMRIQFFFDSTNFVLLLFVLALIGSYVELHNGFKHTYSINDLYFASIAGLLTPVVTAFPAALGNSSVSLPNRIAFIIDSTIILSAIQVAVLSGIVIIRIVDIDQRKTVVIALLMVMIAVCMLDGFGLRNIKIREVSQELKDNTYQNHYYSCKDFISGLEKYNKGEDVRINANELPTEIDNILNFDLFVDPEHWVNWSIAEYYGFRSISVSPE